MGTFRDFFRNRPRDREVPDPIPHELSGPALAPPTIRETIQQTIRSELSIIAQDRGLESFEDADDFSEVDAEADLLTPYEAVLMVPEDGESVDGEEDLPKGTPAPTPAVNPGDPSPTPTPTPETAPVASESPETPS